jgi:hypothetical protein
MKTLLKTIFIAGCLSVGAAAYPETGLTPNLVRDGRMEQWNEASPGTGLYGHLTHDTNRQMSTTDKGNLLVPSIFSQLAATDFILKMENEDVFSGKHSLRFQGAAYFEKASEDAYNTSSGDIYVVRYMAKGRGNTVMHIHVYGDGEAYILEQKGTSIADRWTLMEQRVLVGGSAPTTIYPRLAAAEEMLIDDVFIGRKLREDETADVARVPTKYDRRVAFASAASPAPVIDGRPDDECWKSAVAFSGFRLYSDNTCLAPEQTQFRLLHDEQALYFAIGIMLPDAQQVSGDLKTTPLSDDHTVDDQTGEVYSGRHSVEIFIQPPGQSRYVQCVVSLDGYRYDGVGLDSSWNGNWTYAMSVGKDRWFLEMRIPASDLKLEKITSTEDWRLNVVRNMESFYSTWSATGNDYHNPFAFGTLITQDFPDWRQERLRAWDAMRKKAVGQGAQRGLLFADRLERAARFTETLPVKTDGAKLDWEMTTRLYMLMNFVDGVYRGMDAEMMYAAFFVEK